MPAGHIKHTQEGRERYVEARDTMVEKKAMSATSFSVFLNGLVTNLHALVLDLVQLSLCSAVNAKPSLVSQTLSV